MENRYRALKRENELLSDELSNPDWEEVKKLLYAISISKMGLFDREIVKRDIINMTLEAEKRGECFKDVIGDDKRAFYKDMVDSRGKASWKERLLLEFYQLSAAGLLFVLAIVFYQTTGMTPTAPWVDDPGMIELSLPAIAAWLIGNVIFILLNRYFENRYIFEKGVQRHIPTIVTMLFLVAYCLAAIRVIGGCSVTFEVYWAVLPGIFVPLVIVTKRMFDVYMQREAEKYM